MRVSVLGFVRASVRNKHGFHAFLTRGMAKIQVIMALTLDGFLPHEDEMLMRWVRENKRYGFPRWQRQATFHIYPHYGLMDLLNVKEKHDKDCIYLAGVGDGGSAEYADGLFRYNVIVKTCSDICFTIGQKNCQMFVAKLHKFHHPHNRMRFYPAHSVLSFPDFAVDTFLPQRFLR